MTEQITHAFHPFALDDAGAVLIRTRSQWMCAVCPSARASRRRVQCGRGAAPHRYPCRTRSPSAPRPYGDATRNQPTTTPPLATAPFFFCETVEPRRPREEPMHAAVWRQQAGHLVIGWWRYILPGAHCSKLVVDKTLNKP